MPQRSVVTPDYFATVGTPLIRGRFFTSADRPGTEPVAIVGETMARVAWPGEDAIGRCLYIGKPDSVPCSRVVGVVKDVRPQAVQRTQPLQYYVVLGQFAQHAQDLVVRPAGDPARLIPALRRAIRAMSPSPEIPTFRSLQEAIEPQVRPWRVGAAMFGLFAALALAMAALGMYSVMAYLVAQRAHEIGVRAALGARAPNIAALVLRGSIGTTAFGVAIGGLFALGGGRYLQPLLFQTSANDPMVFGAVAMVMLGAAVVAGLLPAARAWRVDPVEALRAD
jgi:hypothetical protein